MTKLTDIFSAVYIVNLPERTDRRLEMEAELKKSDLSADGSQVSFFPAIKPASKDEFPSIGAKGCFLSHLEILKQALAKKADTVLFMEDDLAISAQLKQFAPKLHQMLKQTPWSILYLGHIETMPAPGEQEFKLIDCGKDYPIRTTHFYAVNKETIPRLINFLEIILTRPSGHAEGGPMHYDGALTTFRQQNPDIITLLASPNLGWQKSSRSDIAPGRWFDTLPIIKELAAISRKLKNKLKD